MLEELQVPICLFLINFNKLALIAFGCEEAWVEEIRKMMHCLMVKLPIVYLGIPLGANLCRVETWMSVIEKITFLEGKAIV